MALFFLLVLVPLKERYLKEKYRREFEAYAARTGKLIPMVLQEKGEYGANANTCQAFSPAGSGIQ